MTVRWALFWGRWGVFLVATKSGPYWGAAGAKKLIHLPQYNNFMGIGCSIGELLEMLLCNYSL
jgi:hypothetical protein